jgi:hypothetical protein
MYHIAIHRISASMEKTAGVEVDGARVQADTSDGVETVGNRIPLFNDHHEHFVEVYF